MLILSNVASLLFQLEHAWHHDHLVQLHECGLLNFVSASQELPHHHLLFVAYPWAIIGLSRKLKLIEEEQQVQAHAAHEQW